jgi:hypothetical protein
MVTALKNYGRWLQLRGRDGGGGRDDGRGSGGVGLNLKVF